MSKSNRDSPLVAAVLALQDTLNELERVGGKITAADLTGDFDVEYIQKLMTRFAECGDRISREVTGLSVQLQEARTRAESIAQGVARQAEVFEKRRNEIYEKLEQFRLIGERVRELNLTFKQSEELKVTDTSALKAQLGGLIQELHGFRDSARASQLKTLEKEAGSLVQSLQALQAKLDEF